MSDISPDLVARMEALVRTMSFGFPAVIAQFHPQDTGFGMAYSEAASIVALLPIPVDPDMVEAREAVCRSHHDKHPESPWHQEQAEIVRSGANDRMLDVLAAFEGIKRGRELAGGAS